MQDIVAGLQCIDSERVSAGIQHTGLQRIAKYIRNDVSGSRSQTIDLQ